MRAELGLGGAAQALAVAVAGAGGEQPHVAGEEAPLGVGQEGEGLIALAGALGQGRVERLGQAGRARDVEGPELAAVAVLARDPGRRASSSPTRTAARRRRAPLDATLVYGGFICHALPDRMVVVVACLAVLP